MFVREFEVKLLQVNSADELRQKAALVADKGLEFMVSELIPGPDSLLSSYYTHIDDDGHALFKFTKQVIRRMPPNFVVVVTMRLSGSLKPLKKGSIFFVASGLPELPM